MTKNLDLTGKTLYDTAGHIFRVTAINGLSDYRELSGTTHCPAECAGRHEVSPPVIVATDEEIASNMIFGWKIVGWTDPSRSEAVISLAANLYTFATRLGGMPFQGTIKEYGEINEEMYANAVADLHDFLVLHESDLDDEWFDMIDHTASVEAFDLYGS
jgi:hypothetical protein